MKSIIEITKMSTEEWIESITNRKQEILEVLKPPPITKYEKNGTC